MLLRLAAIALSVLLCGCRVDRLAARADAPPPPALPAGLAARFAYERAPIEADLVRVADEPEWEKFRGTYALPAGANGGGAPATVTFELWRTRTASGPRPVIVIVPILAGKYVECEHLGRLMARSGYHSFFVWREENLIPLSAGNGDDEPLETKLRRAVGNVRRTLDWVLARPDVAPDRVGLVGISLGAICGTVLMAVEPRIGCGVLIMGGGDMAGIVADSRETPVRRYKLRQMKEKGLTDEGFRAAIRARLASDPLVFAPYIGAERVQQWIAKYDNRVPAPYQWKLWEALGRPEGYAVPCGHYTSIFYLGFAERHALGFLGRALDLPPRVPPEPRPAAPAAAPPPPPASKVASGTSSS